MPCSERGYSTTNGSVHSKKDYNVLEVGFDLCADADFSHQVLDRYDFLIP